MNCRAYSIVAPQSGLEPRTHGLTVRPKDKLMFRKLNISKQIAMLWSLKLPIEHISNQTSKLSKIIKIKI